MTIQWDPKSRHVRISNGLNQASCGTVQFSNGLQKLGKKVWILAAETSKNLTLKWSGF